MKVAAAVAEILKREGTSYIFGYPRNPVIDSAAAADIRTIIVRQERTGVHMADALSRITSGEKIGVFSMQRGPGTENAFGGVAQAFSDSVPLIVLPGGQSRDLQNMRPNFSAMLNFRHVTKWIEQPVLPGTVVSSMRRAYMQARNGRPGPSLVEIPNDVFDLDVPEPFEYKPTKRYLSAPDPRNVRDAAEELAAAKFPVIYAGQGVHYSKAWDQLRAIAELLQAPVLTSLAGKSAFDETHPLALGTGSVTYTKQLRHFLNRADLILGIGCSFSSTDFGVAMPPGKRIIHATLDSTDAGKDLDPINVLIGDAALTLDALIGELSDRFKRKPHGRNADAEVQAVKQDWLKEWMPTLTSNATPLSPYRVIWDLMHTVDVANTIVTHDSGSPRNQLTPFWEAKNPLSYIGWGKSTQLGYGLGLAMGAKLARPDKLCINVWGDAAIGFTGMDLETAVRERIPILSILFNNFTMAAEHASMRASTEKFRATDISGNYAELAKALGLHAERVTEPGAIIPAIKKAVAKIQDGQPALLEFITEYSSPRSLYP